MRGTSRVAGMAVAFGTALAVGQLTHIGASWFDAEALGGINTLAVTPSHGRAAAPFVAVYQVTPCVTGPGVSITFSWNGLPSGAAQALGTATLDSTCRATLSVTPPLNPATHAAPAPGAYAVYGYVPLPTGGAATGTEASATYTIDITPSATPTPTARSSATSASTSSAAPSASPALSPSTSSPATSGQPSASAASGAGASPSTMRTAPLTLPWWRSVGGLLLLGGVSLGVLLLALTLLIIWLNDRRRTPSQTSSVADRAA